MPDCECSRAYLDCGQKEGEMAYSELIKNFEKIRSYMREFYVFGFKSRNGYDRKAHARMTMNAAG